MRTEFLEKLSFFEKSIGVSFVRKELLARAFTHSSYANFYKKEKYRHNERLEFFGDAVLKLVVSEYFFEKYPDMAEGDLTKLRAGVVADKSLAKLAEILNLGEYILFSRSEMKTGGKIRGSNLANALEAFLGAYYLDQGLDKVKQFFFRFLDEHKAVWENENLDYKSVLQESLQQRQLDLPEYTVLKEEGPEHHKLFCVQVRVKTKGGEFEAKGEGWSKKEAEKEAARKMLELFLKR
jgi:ribonuclease III